MLFSDISNEVRTFIEELDNEISKIKKDATLTKIQKFWLGFCLMGILVTGKINWAAFEFASLGSYKQKALSFMAQHAKIPFELLFNASVRNILALYNIKEGMIVIDDYDRSRSKNTTKLFGVYKTKDKKTNGFCAAQNFVLAILVTDKITFPIGFMQYQPCLKTKQWNALNRQERAEHIPLGQRTKKPRRTTLTKIELSIAIISNFKKLNKQIKITNIIADSAYMCPDFVSGNMDTYPEANIISQIRSNQLVSQSNRNLVTVEDYFSSKKKQTLSLKFRTHKSEVSISSGRLAVKSLNRVCHVVALQYPGADTPRYLCAVNKAPINKRIVEAYAFRWPVEVVIEDLKVYEGQSGKSSMQQSHAGTRCSQGLSLLCDNFLLSHPKQVQRAKQSKPLYTVGTFMQELRVDALVDAFRKVLDSPHPHAELDKFCDCIKNTVVFRPSLKHMSGHETALSACTNSNYKVNTG